MAGGVITVARGKGRSEQGSLSLEAAVLGPGMLLIIGLLIVAGRVAMAHGGVEQAAAAAARAASLARTPGEAHDTAASAALATLEQQGLQCASLHVHVDTAGFSVPVGQPATVSATVTCPVLLSDVAMPGLPGSKTVEADAISPLDRYRER